MDIEAIKRLLKETGRTQRELATHLGVDPAAVTRLLAGQRRLRLDEAPKVEAFFAEAGGHVRRAARRPAANVLLRAAGEADPDAAPRDLPVYGSAQGGTDGMTITYEPIEWIRRPQALEGVVEAFAFYVVGDSMSPRFRHGERLLVHPRRPPRPGDDVLVILRDGHHDGDGFSALVKTLERQTPELVTLSQYNPARHFDVGRSAIDRILLIVGNYFFG